MLQTHRKELRNYATLRIGGLKEKSKQEPSQVSHQWQYLGENQNKTGAYKQSKAQ